MPRLLGYLNPGYALSLGEFGVPRELAGSGAWILTRQIPSAAELDGMNAYPLLFCQNWQALEADVRELRGLVSMTAVTDPFAEATPSDLSRAFPHLVSPFKEHFVIELRRASPSRHHRAGVKYALRRCRIEIMDQPVAWIDDWHRLYGELVRRKEMRDSRAFSRAAFERQLDLPGCVGIAAVAGNRRVSMSLWFAMGEVVYYHLAASDEDGYAASASYALVDAAIGTFSERGARYLSIGAGAGVAVEREDGLTRFKEGWATGTRATYLCGRIYQRETYERLRRRAVVSSDPYFPEYRRGEFS
jgi:hypothetical protein